MSSEQLTLPMKDGDRARLANAKIRTARRAVADRVGHKTLAESWGCSVTKVADKIEERDRNYLKPHEELELELLDVDGFILAAKCEVTGYDMPERKHAKTDREIREAIPGTLRKYLREEFAELIERDLGIR